MKLPDPRPPGFARSHGPAAWPPPGYHGFLEHLAYREVSDRAAAHASALRALAPLPQPAGSIKPPPPAPPRPLRRS